MQEVLRFGDVEVVVRATAESTNGALRFSRRTTRRTRPSTSMRTRTSCLSCSRGARDPGGRRPAPRRAGRPRVRAARGSPCTTACRHGAGRLLVLTTPAGLRDSSALHHRPGDLGPEAYRSARAVRDHLARLGACVTPGARGRASPSAVEPARRSTRPSWTCAARAGYPPVAQSTTTCAECADPAQLVVLGSPDMSQQFRIGVMQRRWSRSRRCSSRRT